MSGRQSWQDVREMRLREQRRALWLEATEIARRAWTANRGLTRGEAEKFEWLMREMAVIDACLFRVTAKGDPPLRVVMHGE